MEEFKSWDQLTDLEQAQCTFWDMYKDAYGFRPRGIDTSSWTMADFSAEFESLGKAIERAEEDRKAAEAVGVAKFEAWVDEVIASGAADRETALRWIMSGSDCNGDWEYFCYCNSLPYSYFKTAEMM